MDAATCAELHELAHLGREASLDNAVRWLMARLAEAERRGRRRRHRKVRVRLPQGGEFWVEERLLQEQEVNE